MPQIGLALSGGGFRATLYHLGVVRYLRDAGLLRNVTHITSVSGGSVLAAHLVLNWDRYCGSAEDFDEAAQEVIDFVRLDVRNRIVRRYPFALTGSSLQRLLRRQPWRRLSRTGLLELHYERYLFGDTCLFQLPVHPQLHILSTNLSEGSLSSFTRSGLLIESRNASRNIAIKRHRVGLATVPMAVAASSAFPGFFPPMPLTADDVGAPPGEFQTQYFTDGGVYDNLGIRMFRYLEQVQKTSLGRADFEDLGVAIAAWNEAARSGGATPLGRLAQLYAASSCGGRDVDSGTAVAEDPQQFLSGLERLLADNQLGEDAELCRELGIERNGHEAHDPLQNGNGRSASAPSGIAGNRFETNRRLLCAAFEQSTGTKCLRSGLAGFDAVIASDAGKKFQVTRPDRSGGFLRTAMRSSDILMDRVWQLEREHFGNAGGFVFVPITRIVAPDDDVHALHPEVQVQVSQIRTDMDRFSNCEVSGLVRHGYAVTRQACALRRHVFGEPVDDVPPWDPVRGSRAGEDRPARMRGWRGSRPTEATVEARQLQKSSRRTYANLFLAPRDWVTYLYLPIFALLFGILPLAIWRAYRHAHVNATLTKAISETRGDYRKMLELLEYGPIDPWEPMEFVEADSLDPLLAEKGLDIISDTRITDLRRAFLEGSGASDRRVYIYRHVSIRKTEHSEGETGLRLPTLWGVPDVSIRCENWELNPELRRCQQVSAAGGESESHWEIKLDFRNVAIGHTVDVVVEAIVPITDAQLRKKTEWWRFNVDANPEVATGWILLPHEQRKINLGLIRYDNDEPNNIEMVEPTHHAIIQGGSVLTWSVTHPKPGYTYSCRWMWEM